MAKNYLIVIDVQNDFINGAFKNEEAQNAVSRIYSAIINHKGPIIATMDTHTTIDINSLEISTFGKHCMIGTFGWNMPENILNALNMHGNYCGYTTKQSFGSMKLPELIKKIEENTNINIESAKEYSPNFTLVGFDTDICVISNALILRAAFPNSVITVYSDCCAGTTEENHIAALNVMKSCNITVKQLYENM